MVLRNIRIGQSRIGQITGSELANHGPFWSFRVRSGQSRSIFVDLGPNWPVTVHFGPFGSELANHGPFWSFRVRSGQSRSILVILGPNWPITGRFGHFESELANHGPFWWILVNSGPNYSTTGYFDRSRSKTFRTCNNGFVFVWNRKSIDKNKSLKNISNHKVSL